MAQPMQSERNELQSTGYQKKQKQVTEHTHMHQLSINARINQVQLLHCTLWFRLNCSLPPGNKFHNTNSYLVFIFCNLLTTFRGMAAFELVNVLFCFVLFYVFAFQMQTKTQTLTLSSVCQLQLV